MKKIIHHLRRQPEHIKRHILHVTMFVAGIVLLSVWVYSLGANFGSADTQKKISQDLRPFSILKDNIIPKSW